MNDVTKDYLEVLYQGSDKIYIPVEKIDLLSKFSGRGGFAPKINKLGGTEWEKTKARVRSKVTDMADKLIKLYAEREMRKGSLSLRHSACLQTAFRNLTKPMRKVSLTRFLQQTLFIRHQSFCPVNGTLAAI